MESRGSEGEEGGREGGREEGREGGRETVSGGREGGRREGGREGREGVRREGGREGGRRQLQPQHDLCPHSRPLPPLPTSDLAHDDGALLGAAGPAGSADEGEHALHAV